MLLSETVACMENTLDDALTVCLGSSVLARWQWANGCRQLISLLPQLCRVCRHNQHYPSSSKNIWIRVVRHAQSSRKQETRADKELLLQDFRRVWSRQAWCCNLHPVISLTRALRHNYAVLNFHASQWKLASSTFLSRCPDRHDNCASSGCTTCAII